MSDARPDLPSALGTGPTGAPRRPAGERLDRIGDIFTRVRTGQARTIAELSLATGLARSTVAHRVNRLIEAGLLRHSSELPAGRGRPPLTLQFNPGAGAVLAAHLGLSAARVAVTDLAGDVLADATFSRPIADDPHSYVDALCAQFDALLASLGPDRVTVRAVALAVPSPTELSAAPRHALPTQGWLGYPLAETLGERFGVPGYLDTDVNALALGEHRLSWPDAEVLVCVKAGTAIGAGVVTGGEVVRGAQSMAGGIGHTHVHGSAAPCWCGNRGCLDAVAGGAALAAEVRAHGLPAEDVRDVVRLAAAGALPAVHAVRQAGRGIGEVLTGVVNLLNPDVIAVWGYLIDAEEPLLAGIRETLYQGSLPAVTRSLQLAPAGIGQNAGVRGAALLAIDQLLHPDAIEHTIAHDGARGASSLSQG